MASHFDRDRVPQLRLRRHESNRSRALALLGGVTACSPERSLPTPNARARTHSRAHSAPVLIAYSTILGACLQSPSPSQDGHFSIVEAEAAYEAHRREELEDDDDGEPELIDGLYADDDDGEGGDDEDTEGVSVPLGVMLFALLLTGAVVGGSVHMYHVRRARNTSGPNTAVAMATVASPVTTELISPMAAYAPPIQEATVISHPVERHEHAGMRRTLLPE